MKNITHIFEDAYIPKAIILFKNEFTTDFYAEAHDIDETGTACNAHPLSDHEAATLAKLLDKQKQREKFFLQPEGLLPEKVIYINTARGFAIWYTEPTKRSLFFSTSLGIPNGSAYLPAMIWKATEEELTVYALKSEEKPQIDTPLYHAPFFNIYEKGNVCMGTVERDTGEKSLEQFIADWEGYFFNSYFSHLINKQNPVKGNIVQLWQQQVKSQNPFPADCLKKTRLTVKNLIQ